MLLSLALGWPRSWLRSPAAAVDAPACCRGGGALLTSAESSAMSVESSRAATSRGGAPGSLPKLTWGLQKQDAGWA